MTFAERMVFEAFKDEPSVPRKKVIKRMKDEFGYISDVNYESVYVSISNYQISKYSKQIIDGRDIEKIDNKRVSISSKKRRNERKNRLELKRMRG